MLAPLRKSGGAACVNKKAPFRLERGLVGPIELVAVGLAVAGPDEGVAFAIFVIEQVGVDRRVEARIVQLDRDIVAAFGGALRPPGPDLGAADIDPVAGGVVVGPAGLGNDADAFGLNAQGDDFALVFGAGFLERTNVSHHTSPCCFRARDHRGLDGDRRAGGDRRRIRLADQSEAEDGRRTTFLSREEWAARPGEESFAPPLRLGDRGAAVLRPDQAMERPCGPRAE